MMTGPYNLLIPAGVLQNSADVFNILDPDSGGAQTFSRAFSASGTAPATHYGARTMLEEGTVNALQNMTVQQFKTYVDQVSALRGRTPVGSITAFKNSLIMGTGDFWAFIAANGLQPIEEATAAAAKMQSR